MKKESDYVFPKEILAVFQLMDGRFIRKTKYDQLWHICSHPLSWTYNRIPHKSLGGYMSHKVKSH